MRESEFVFDSVDLLYYHLQKISLKRDGSNVDSPKWLKNKKVPINPKNNDDNSLQYALIAALNNKQIKGRSERISQVMPFINQYDWKEIVFRTQQKDRKKFELNNKTIAPNIVIVPYDNEEIRLAYKSKYKTKRENQVILLMITDLRKRHHLTIKSLPALLQGITSTWRRLLLLKLFYSYSTEKKLEKHEKVCNDHDYCYVKVSEKTIKY